MPDDLSLALSVPGVEWVAFAALVAGVVYGFAGFGAALIFFPMAMAFMPPAIVVPAFQISALISLFTVLPRAVRYTDVRTSTLLVVSSLIAAPLGVYLLLTVPEPILRWVVSIIVIVTLSSVLMGWRYHSAPGNLTTASIGAAAGVMGGATGLNGPIVILFRLSGGDSAQTTRANMVVFLTMNSTLIIPIMVLQGVMTVQTFWVGMVLLLPYGAGTLIGQALFKPSQEGIYQKVAYTLIVLAALIGLPIW